MQGMGKNVAKLVVTGCPSEVGVLSVALCLATSGNAAYHINLITSLHYGSNNAKSLATVLNTD